VYLLTERDWAGVPHILAGLLMAGAALALLFVSAGGPSRAGSPAELTAHSSAGPMPRIAVRNEPAGRQFTVAGASFQVAGRPGATWAAAVRRQDPGTGRRWVIAAVAVENLSRERFNPGLLSYLLRSRGGTLIAPQRAGVVGPAGLGTASGLPAGARAEQRLVFRVPAALRRPVLAIQPSPSRALEVRVPLAEG
jgi:hypothetical protein